MQGRSGQWRGKAGKRRREIFVQHKEPECRRGGTTPSGRRRRAGRKDPPNFPAFFLRCPWGGNRNPPLISPALMTRYAGAPKNRIETQGSVLRSVRGDHIGSPLRGLRSSGTDESVPYRASIAIPKNQKNPPHTWDEIRGTTQIDARRRPPQRAHCIVRAAALTGGTRLSLRRCDFIVSACRSEVIPLWPPRPDLHLFPARCARVSTGCPRHRGSISISRIPNFAPFVNGLTEKLRKWARLHTYAAYGILSSGVCQYTPWA